MDPEPALFDECDETAQRDRIGVDRDAADRIPAASHLAASFESSSATGVTR